MDLHFFIFQWLLLVIPTVPVTVQGVDLDVCSPDSGVIEGDGLFETHTFEAEEGILLVSRKLLGTITLFGNDSSTYSFDEPYFEKTYNVKAKPRPAHFKIEFIDVSSSSNISVTTLSPEPKVATTTRGPKFYQTSSGTKYFPLENDEASAFSSSSTYDSNLNSGFGDGATTWSTVTSSSTNTTSSASNATSTAVTDTPEDTDIHCVVAKIYQIYDLDREVADTHYLTISNTDDPLWGFPVIVVIRVTDINDNSPTFVKESLNSRVSKNTRPGSIVAEIKAVDEDIGINADLRYSLPFYTQRIGNGTGSSDFPTVLIHEKLGIVALVSPISNLQSPTQITFSVIVKDRGDSYVSNRATASVTIFVVDDTWAPTINPPNEPIHLSGGAIAGIVLGILSAIVLAISVVIYWRKKRGCRHNAQLEFMLDDENLIPA